MKKVIYSCITGGYDNVPEHKYIAPGWDCVLFTDNIDLIRIKKIGCWTIKPLVFNKLTNVKNARWHKINAHILFPEYDYSLWLDSNITINNKNIFELMENLITNNVLFAAPNHPDRKCIYQEAEVIKDQNIDIPDIVNKEIRLLKTKKYPENNGLTETNILFRQHNKLHKILNLWWSMVEKYSKRDQLSFNYAAWKTGTKITPIYTNNDGFGIHHYVDDITFIHSERHNRYRYLNLDKCRVDLCKWYKEETKKDLNLDNPQTFNEKIQYLKLYNSTPIKTKLADKFLVRKWVADKIGKKYLIPLLGVYDSFDEIDFDKLPNKFVIKCNHGAGYNIIVKDKSNLDLDDVKQKINNWMSEDFAFKNGYELHYHNIKHKIIIEKFIENKKSTDLNDYKIYCFNGKVRYIQVISERTINSHSVSFYDKNWKKQDWWDNIRYDGDIEKPKQLNKVLKLAGKLCKGFNFVRVDLYYLDTDNIYFGEMTFTPSSGTMAWSSEKINSYLGDLIKLPVHEYNIETGRYRLARRDMKYNIKMPVIQYTKHNQKIKLNIFGTQVLKIKDTDKDYVVYLLGLQIFKRHLSHGYAKINIFGIRVFKYKI